jgi:hypothetical protein
MKAWHNHKRTCGSQKALGRPKGKIERVLFQMELPKIPQAPKESGWLPLFPTLGVLDYYRRCEAEEEERKNVAIQRKTAPARAWAHMSYFRPTKALDLEK